MEQTIDTDTYTGPYWRANGAIFIVLKALKDTERALASMYREQRIVNDKLEVFFDKYPEDTHSEEEMEEFGDICERLWLLESDLGCCTRTTILMAIVDLESTVNRFCFFNLGEVPTDAIERLSIAEKLEVCHSVLGLSNFKGTRYYQAIKSLLTWRNAFAHGKCTDMPFNKIKENHLKAPKKYPEAFDELQEMLSLIESYLLICTYLPSISKHPYTSGYSVEWEEIEEYLVKIKAFQFEDGRIVGKRRSQR